MRSVSASEANRRFSELLREVGKGETFVVTSRGKPVATLAPADDEMERREKAKQKLLERLRSQPTLNLPRWTRDELYDDEL